MNKVVLIGRLTADPHVGYIPGSNLAITNFTMAVSRPKGKDREQEADFIRCVALGKTGQIIEQYVKKGRRLAVFGRLKTGRYKDTEGNMRYSTEVMVDEFDFIDSKDSKKEVGFEDTPYSEEGSSR